MSELTLYRPQADGRVIGVIGIAHFSSHFFQLVLPPLYPMMRDTMQVSFLELGLIMTVFFTVSALCQVLAGILVDRFGPQIVLPAGIAIVGAAIALIGLAPNHWVMVVLAGVAGFGNSVYHPADYSVLSAKVSARRLAFGYSVHTVSGTLGWAAAPFVVFTLAEAFGWRPALMIVGLAGVVLAALVAIDRGDLVLPQGHARKAAKGETVPVLSIFLSPPVLAAFFFFVVLTLALNTLQSWLPTLLPRVQDVTTAFAATVTGLYLLANASGSLAGGWIADATRNFRLIIGLGLASAAVMVLVLGNVSMPAAAVLALAMVTGFCVGITIPSRDMLVRQATPPGATGKVFGFVYSGLDLGALIVPVVIGPMLDHGLDRLPFAFVAAALAGTIVTTSVVGARRA